jgi:hypothetical protein
MKLPVKIYQCLFGFCLIVLVPFGAIAQQSDEQGWHFQLMPYALVAKLHGTIGVRDLPDVEVEASAKDVIKNLKFGALIYAEAANDNWAITSDLIYLKVGKDTRTGVFIKDGSLESKQLAWEVGVLRKVFSCVELGVGARYNNLEAGIDLTTASLNGPVTRSREKSVNWVDPIVITRIKGNVGDNLILQLRGDIGGFGIGSDLAWQVQAYADYKFSELFQLGLGYRYISVDYEKGTGEDHFLFDVNTKGPAIRFGFNF